MLVDAFDAFLIDLDGVVYLGSEPLPGAVNALRELRKRSKAIRFLTNDPRPHRAQVVARLHSYGISADIGEVVTSGQVAANFACQRGYKQVLVVGSDGLAEEATDAGLTVVHDRSADCVIVGCDERVSYKELDAAVACILAGAGFVATNRDATYPVAPGVRAMATGGIVAAIEAGSRRRPITVGKPMPPMFQMAIRTLREGARVAVVGDSPRTDIEGARRAALFAVLVADTDDTEGWPSVITPDVVIRDLAHLFTVRAVALSKPAVPSTWPFVVETCVGGVVFDSAGRVLMQRRRDADVWALPTGRVEPGESLQQAIERELMEEMRLSATAERLSGVYSDPSRQVFAFESGWIIQAVTIVFVCRTTGTPVPDGAEVSEAEFFPLDRLPPVPFGDDEWVADALLTQATGEVALEYKSIGAGPPAVREQPAASEPGGPQ